MPHLHTKLTYRSSGVPGFMPGIEGDPRHIVARKLECKVDVHFVTAPSAIRTMEGVVHANIGDAVITGADGERWRVSRSHFADKYHPVSPTAMGESGVYMSLPSRIMALCMVQDFDVWLADGVSRLSGRTGDWLVDYGDGSLGIVAAAVFAATYEIVL